jgi:hypothetical protein
LRPGNRRITGGGGFLGWDRLVNIMIHDDDCDFENVEIVIVDI